MVGVEHAHVTLRENATEQHWAHGTAWWRSGIPGRGRHPEAASRRAAGREDRRVACRLHVVNLSLTLPGSSDQSEKSQTTDDFPVGVQHSRNTR